MCVQKSKKSLECNLSFWRVKLEGRVAVPALESQGSKREKGAAAVQEATHWKWKRTGKEPKPQTWGKNKRKAKKKMISR